MNVCVTLSGSTLSLSGSTGLHTIDVQPVFGGRERAEAHAVGFFENNDETREAALAAVAVCYGDPTPAPVSALVLKLSASQVFTLRQIILWNGEVMVTQGRLKTAGRRHAVNKRALSVLIDLGLVVLDRMVGFYAGTYNLADAGQTAYLTESGLASLAAHEARTAVRS